MKLLLDQNLSPRLAGLLSDVYPGTMHVQDVGMGRADDLDAWMYAKLHEFTIVSKDSDFADMSVWHGAPPKVIWIRLGNCTTASVAMLLHNSSERVLQFLGSKETCLILGRR